MDKLIPSKKFCEQHEIPLSTLYFWRWQRRPGLVKIGKRIFVNPEELLKGFNESAEEDRP